MARLIAAFAALLLLAGCESDDDFWQQTQSTVSDAWPFGSQDATATAAAATPVNARCAAVAYARKADARANGFDDEMVDQVYQRTYAECFAWERDHANPRQPG
jgi:hypothetical protein